MTTDTIGDSRDAPDSPLVSVIIVTWNSAPDLPACLAGLQEAAQHIALEVVCIDNSSRDESCRAAEALGATVLPLSENLGFARAANRAAQSSRGAYLLFLNPDVVVEPSTISGCIERLRDPHVGLVGCNLRRADGRPDPAAARMLRTVRSVALETIGLTRLSPRLDHQYFPGWDRADDRDVPCVNGAFMLTSRSTFESAGGFDETSFMYLEDLELCRAVAARGLSVRFAASERSTHLGGTSTARGTARQRQAAYLHRVDADIEAIARSQGRVARLATVALYHVRAMVGLGLSVVSGDGYGRSKYRLALRWLVTQWGSRNPPPPVPT